MATRGEGHVRAGAEEGQDPRPKGKPVVKRADTEGRPLVFFNVETTGFERNSHITQIAASMDSDDLFNTFVWPIAPIHIRAQGASGITVVGEEMFHHNQPVEFLTIRPALERFINFLRQQQEPVVLVGHNIQSFGSRPLVQALQNCNLIDQFQEVVHCFSDIRLLLEDRRPPELENLQIPTLYTYCTENDIGPADGKKDAATLKLIRQRVGLQSADFRASSFTIAYIMEDLHYLQENA